MKIIYIVTSNIHKYREIKKAFSTVKKFNLKILDLPHPELQGERLREIVEFKLEYLRKMLVGKSFFVEDSGLFIKSLNNFPGVYSSYVFKSIGCDGILKLMENVSQRDGYFESCIGYCENESVVFFEGICKGKIAHEKRGNYGFGFDPIFIPSGKKITFAQSINEKIKISHRTNAVKKLCNYLDKFSSAGR